MSEESFDLDLITQPVRRPRNLTLPFLTNRLYRVIKWATTSTDPDQQTGPKDLEETTSLDEANIVSSEQVVRQFDYSEGQIVEGERLHTPVLDIDVPALLVDSSTPGKHHLYFDVPMTWGHYLELLDVMAKVGILEPGYVSASRARGFTAVRLPWIRKD